MGSKLIFDLQYRQSFVFIGVFGAPNGTYQVKEQIGQNLKSDVSVTSMTRLDSENPLSQKVPKPSSEYKGKSDSEPNKEIKV